MVRKTLIVSICLLRASIYITIMLLILHLFDVACFEFKAVGMANHTTLWYYRILHVLCLLFNSAFLSLLINHN